MKKYLIALSMMLALTTTAVTAQKHNQPLPPSKELVDSTRQDEVEVFSDTTTVDSAETVVTRTNHRVNINLTNASAEDIQELFNVMGLGVAGISGAMFFVLMVIIILFVLAPILILALIFYFIYKNRKQRLKFAEQAMKNGQPVPDEAMQPQPQQSDPDLWTKGMRQVFLGIGLALFFGITAGKIGVGIGALVICIGAGNLIIARRQKEKEFMGNNDIYKYE